MRGEGYQTVNAPDTAPVFRVSLAQGAGDLLAAQRLRYEVFVAELGGDGPLVDHAARLERDRFDPYAQHLLLHDDARGQVVGVYRMMDQNAADRAGQFYSEDEYDLAPLYASGRRLLELGRSCLHPDYRGGPGMMHLWAALAGYIAEQGVQILFGTASFHGTDTGALAAPLSLLHHRHLAPPSLRVRARSGVAMDLMPEGQIDRVAAMRAVPSLIKAYLRLGGTVGEGAYVDHAFNTTDVCLVMDTAALNARQRSIYTGLQ